LEKKEEKINKKKGKVEKKSKKKKKCTVDYYCNPQYIGCE
jgi:hypothetical protein